VPSPLTRHRLLLLLLLLFGATLLAEAAPPFPLASGGAPQPEAGDYPQIGINSRSTVWVLAQMHLFFGALVLAVPLFVLVIEWLGLITRDERYDDMAHEFMKITLTAYSITALSGGGLTIALFLLYPHLMSYLMQVFGAQVLFYALLFLCESLLLYLYYYGWYALRYGRRKWLHLTIGGLLNLVGLLLMVVANSWSTFMTAPSGVDESGAVTGSLMAIMDGPLWHPMNLHRFIANIAFGGAVVGAYAGWRFLTASDRAARAHYDWMGYTANFVAILGLLPLPFAGYWLMAEIYAYSQQMGIMAMGGILAWLWILQGVLIGVILFAGNFYLWSGMRRTPGGSRYRRYIPWIAATLTLGLLVWVTPHTLVLSAAEAVRLGGSHHHSLGPLGLMPAKNIAVNLMLIATFLSFQLYRRADKVATSRHAALGNAALIAIYSVAVANILFTGVYYGYFTDTVYKVGSSVPQVASTLVVIISGLVIDSIIYRKATRLPCHWGEISDRSQYALFALPIAFSWLMALMGYLRSALRSHWHVYGIMQDRSPDNFIPSIGDAANMVSLVTLLFLAAMVFIFWIATLSNSRQIPPTGSEAVSR
jgi:cytochrome d ubiquinol oxidase subunit I